MLDVIAPVTENRPLTGGHFLLSVKSPRQATALRPGQFAMLRLLGRSDVLLRRPMSIYDLKPAKGRSKGPREIVQFLYKIVGRGTRLLADLKPGDGVGVLAPLGHGFYQEEYLAQAERADEILLVAGGIGIAALLLPSRELAERGFTQRLFFGGRTKFDLVGTSDLKPLVRNIVLATEDGSRGHEGFVTAALAEHLDRYPEKRFLLMACGPWAMLHASVQLAMKFGHPCLVSMENRMGCGLGVCLGCCIRVQGEGHGAYQRVCTEGPVFWADQVVWERDTVPKT